MNKKSLLGGIIVLLLIAGVIIYFQSKKHTASNSSVNQVDNQQTMTASSSQDTASTTPNQGSTGGMKKLSYGDAIKAYPNRIQFVNCGGNPGTVSVKRNTPVMLDNRDKTKHTIKGGGQSFTIAGYDYAVMYPKTEGTFQLTCDGGGSSILNVEK
jgi:hypothetical protein